MKKTAKFIGIGAVLLLLLCQLYQPERANPPIDASRTLQARVEVPAGVDAIFRRSCFDCHSHATRWPWSSHQQLLIGKDNFPPVDRLELPLDPEYRL